MPIAGEADVRPAAWVPSPAVVSMRDQGGVDLPPAGQV